MSQVSRITGREFEYYNWYPIEPISVAELERLREPIERYLTDNSSSEDARLDTARTVADAIWEEHEATAHGDTTTARLVLGPALKLEPNNLYIRFLERKQRAAVKDALQRQ